MKYQNVIATAGLIAMFSTATVYAVDAHHPDAKGSTPAKTAPDAKAGSGMPMGDMHGHMKEMQEQMMKVIQSKDEKEREQLMQEHMKMMQEHMTMMGGDKGAAGKGDMPMDKCLQTMEQRLDSMQQMLDQMLKHQQQGRNSGNPVVRDRG